MSHFSYAPPFQGPHFLTKLLESNILYAHLLIDILSVWWHRKNIKITHAYHSATSKAILPKILVQQEHLYFLFAFCARNYPCWSLWQKTPKTIVLFKLNPLFRPLKLVTLLLFEEMLVLTSYYVILTSVTIIKQGFLRKLFCYEPLVDTEISKH